MNIEALRHPRSILIAQVAGGGLLLAASVLLIPNAAEIGDAIKRSTYFIPLPKPAPIPPTDAMLMQRFLKGSVLTVPELTRLLSISAKTESAQRLTSIANHIADAGGKVALEEITYEILSSGRPDIAQRFIENQPGRHSPSLWRLRFELFRKSGKNVNAHDMVRAAAYTPALAPAKDLTEAAYTLNRPDLIIMAAENHAIAPLTPAQALSLASWANDNKRYDLISHIDRGGGSAWRSQNPWLAMTLAQREGDTQKALHYAALLPAGGDAARESIIMATGDKEAIRNFLLERASKGIEKADIVAERLLAQGFRPDAIKILRQEAAQQPLKDPATERMLYLMGPRPHAEDLEWIKNKAIQDKKWMAIYLERESLSKSLKFLESLKSANDTEILLKRIAIANQARDKEAAIRAMDMLLDGRKLDSDQLKLANTAIVPEKDNKRIQQALAQARLRIGIATPSDRLNLAWTSWNKGDVKETEGYIRAYLNDKPDDADALQLMAEVQAKLSGERTARPWLERRLALLPNLSREKAELLNRLGKTSDAIKIVENLRRNTPGDKRLDILLAQLLITAQNPGRAQKVLQR